MCNVPRPCFNKHTFIKASVFDYVPPGSKSKRGQEQVNLLQIISALLFPPPSPHPHHRPRQAVLARVHRAPCVYSLERGQRAICVDVVGSRRHESNGGLSTD